jgi:hypothetical protein
MFVAEATFHDRETEYETDCASFRSDGRACRLCDNASAAGDADVPGWIADSGHDALSAASAASASAAAPSDGMPGRNFGTGRHGLPNSAASAASAAVPLGRTRLTAGEPADC